MAAKEPQGTSSPLLGEQDVAVCLEQGLSSEHDFQTIIAARPKRVVEWLQDEGVEKLGDFQIQDSLFYAAGPSENGLLTEGHNCRHIDFERFWTNRLHKRSSRAATSTSEEWNEAVKVEAWVVTLKNAAAAENVGLLQPLLRRFQAGKVSMMVFGLPAVMATVEFKWAHWCRNLLWVQLALYLLWVFAFTVFTILFQDEDASASLADVAATVRGQATIALEIIALAAMLPFLYIEAATIVEYGKSWLVTQNIIDALTYINQVAITVMHLTRRHLNSDIILILMAVQCILLWLRLQFYLRPFRASKFAFVDTLRVVLADVKWFLVFLVITMWGFACAFHVLYRSDQDDAPEFSTLWRSLYTVFAAAVGEFESDTYIQHHNPRLTVPLLVLYLFVVTVIMLNLLIALLTNAQEKMTENAGLRAVVSKAQIIDELENTLPGWLKRQGGNRWYPYYIHMLKLAPAQRGELSAEALWAEHGDLLDSSEEVRIRVRALEAKIDALQASIDALVSALPPAAREQAAAASAQKKAIMERARREDEELRAIDQQEDSVFE
ncbi:g2816 [Coccomyxa elongata]